MQVTSGESRARMGEVAHQRSDFVILSDSDPGLEDPREIIQVCQSQHAPV
jgi:UDP-N-acetylmuramyl tripeptide synthase